MQCYPTSLESTARTKGPALVRNGQISSRILEIQQRGAAKVERGIADAVAIAWEILDARPSEARMDHPRGELRMSKAGPYVTFPSKLGALEALAKLKGWNQPQEIKHTVEGLDVLLSGLCRPGIPRESEAIEAEVVEPKFLPTPTNTLPLRSGEVEKSGQKEN